MLNNKTTSTGLSILERDNLEVSTKLLQLREIGIRITLQGIAEIHVSRLAKLSNILTKLEDEIFDEHVLESLTDSAKIERYNLLTQAINSHTNAAKSVLGNTDWASLEIKLQSIKNGGELLEESSTDKIAISKMAGELLAEISQLGNR